MGDRSLDVGILLRDLVNPESRDACLQPVSTTTHVKSRGCKWVTIPSTTRTKPDVPNDRSSLLMFLILALHPNSASGVDGFSGLSCVVRGGVSAGEGVGGAGRAGRCPSLPTISARPGAPGRTGTHPSTRFTSVEWSDRKMCESRADDVGDVTRSRSSRPGNSTAWSERGRMGICEGSETRDMVEEQWRWW